MKRNRIKVVGDNDTAVLKQEIQDLVRMICCYRDGGCVLRNLRCGNSAMIEDGKIFSNEVIQADHLVTRANSATFADTRLIVCLCKACHGWKHWHEKEYEAMVKSVLSQKTIELWDKCETDRQAHKTYKPDWKMEILALKKELKNYERN